MSKICLVTGGCGFIGRNLVKRLINDGWLVDIVDNLSTGYIEELDNINANIIIDNFASKRVKNLILNKKYNTVFHLAASPSVKNSVENPALTTRNNLLSTVSLFEYCVGNVKRIIFSSSAAVYGDSNNIADHNSQKSPKSPYAWQKSSIEDLSKIFCDLYDIDIVSLRYFNVYGPGQKQVSPYSSLVSSWLGCIENKTSLIFEGDGNQSRDMIYIDDVVNANIIAANHNKQFNGEAYNISTGISTTNNEILNYFKDYFYDLDVIVKPARKGDIYFSLGDTEHAKRHLNFISKTPFSEGIIKTFNWYSKQRNKT